MQCFSTIIVCLDFSDFGARIGQFVRHARYNILARQCSGLADGAVSRIFFNAGIRQADALEDLMCGQRTSDCINEWGSIVRVKTNTGTFFIESVNSFQPKGRKACAEFIDLLDGQIMLENEKGMQVRMPAINI